MSEPTTEAGKRLDDLLRPWWPGTETMPDQIPDAIAAIEAEARAMTGVEAVNLRVRIIEAEARAAVLRELREEVEGMVETIESCGERHGSIERAEVLAVIDRRLA